MLMEIHFSTYTDEENEKLEMYFMLNVTRHQYLPFDTIAFVLILTGPRKFSLYSCMLV